MDYEYEKAALEEALRELPVEAPNDPIAAGRLHWLRQDLLAALRDVEEAHTHALLERVLH